MPREGSFALASFGRVRKVQQPAFALTAGRKSFALKRILEAVLVLAFIVLLKDHGPSARATASLIFEPRKSRASIFPSGPMSMICGIAEMP
jgi:hypothetical protein